LDIQPLKSLGNEVLLSRLEVDCGAIDIDDSRRQLKYSQVVVVDGDPDDVVDLVWL
jgi:hypothetical protein